MIMTRNEDNKESINHEQSYLTQRGRGRNRGGRFLSRGRGFTPTGQFNHNATNDQRQNVHPSTRNLRNSFNNQLPPQQKLQKSEEEIPQALASMALNEEDKDPNFYVDSGATTHITNDPEFSSTGFVIKDQLQQVLAKGTKKGSLYALEENVIQAMIVTSTNDHNTVNTTKTPIDVALGASGHNSNIATTTGILSQIESTSSYKLSIVNNFPDISNDKNFISDLINTLSSEFSPKDLRSLHYFLGLKVKYLPNGSFVSQIKYTRDLLEHTKMMEYTHTNTPKALKSIIIPSDEQPIDPTRYRKLVGSLQYLTFTRLDIVHEVNKACQHFQAPTKVYLRAIKRILRYLKGTMEHGIKVFK
ncbi:putative mitochondrial protein [Vitis vinifera]|uniref:Putative mitochondrial protein n=1 Tax=Vitis vinifera TaxID=29760 RepID=A0A438GZI7_VITVI|nr:putative mitochondrial protein [Vitis vinifera]